MSHDTNDLQRYLSANHGTMTVGDLKEALSEFSDDTPVVFSYNYGDHWRTEVAEAARGVETRTVAWSEYHRMPKVLDEEDEDDERETAEDGLNEGATQAELAEHNARTMSVVVIDARAR